MYKIINTENVIIKIDSFIWWYLNSFLDLFEDSWIENINIIESNYIKTSIDLKEQILNWINFYLKMEIVFWYSILKNKNKQIIFRVWNYRIFLEYSENIKKKLRFVENIKFNKK